MPTIFERKHSKRIELKTCKRTVSTLLVPKEIMPQIYKISPYRLTKKGKKIYQFEKLLNQVLKKYRGFLAIGRIPFANKPKLTYQDTGQNLQPLKFRPNEDDWFELGILAYGMGVTRCWLFTYLLRLELSMFGKFANLPKVKYALTTPQASRPRMIYQIFGKRSFIQRILHFRI